MTIRAFVARPALLSRLDHPSVPLLLDHGRWRHASGARYPYLTMAWVEGTPLYDWAREHNPTSRQVLRLLRWSVDSPTGDRSELDFEPSPKAWAQVSVNAMECPGAVRCPVGDACFAEMARVVRPGGRIAILEVGVGRILEIDQLGVAAFPERTVLVEHERDPA